MSKREVQVWVVELDGVPESAHVDIGTGYGKAEARESAEEFRGTQYKARVVRYVPAPRKERKKR
jgi:hypothetical protein